MVIEKGCACIWEIENKKRERRNKLPKTKWIVAHEKRGGMELIINSKVLLNIWASICWRWWGLLFEKLQKPASFVMHLDPETLMIKFIKTNNSIKESCFILQCLEMQAGVPRMLERVRYHWVNTTRKFYGLEDCVFLHMIFIRKDIILQLGCFNRSTPSKIKFANKLPSFMMFLYILHQRKELYFARYMIDIPKYLK